MKILLIELFALLISFSFANQAVAQNKPLACQSDGQAGMKWEGGQWITVSFSPQKFILVQSQESLTLDSVAKILIASPSQVSCKNVKPQISCIDSSGGNLFYDPNSLKGGVAQMLGGSLNTAKKDTVSVVVFSCQPF